MGRFLNRAREGHGKINLAIVTANNHYAGFGPGTANTFRKMLDLSEATWNNCIVFKTDEEKVKSSFLDLKQTTLSDF
jgi:hypothetical protein